MSFDINHILAQLNTGQTPDMSVAAWLQESWDDPEGFAAALAAASSFASRGALPLKSRPGQHHDFFHDLLVRHASSDRVALRSYDPQQGWQTLGYRELHEKASRRATEWARQGVKSGATLCLVYEPGPELLVSLMAALGLGACISFLPPQGKAFISLRLAALKPQHIAAEPHQIPLLRGFEKSLLHSRDEAPALFTSHTYRPDEPVALLFSPLADPPHVPLPLSAAHAWQGALRDGLLIWGLAPEEHLAAPGMPPLQHLPALLLATLICGATFVHLELAHLEREPSLLLAHPLHTLGVCSALRELLLRSRPKPLGNVSHWFRSPEEPLDWEAWNNWVRQSGLASIPTSNALVDAASGGAVLFSPRRKGEIHPDIFPAPGRRWELRDLNLSGQAAPGDVGLFTLVPDEGRPPGHIILSRLRGRFLYTGARDARRMGRVYLAAEVTAAIEGLPFVSGASVTAIPTGGTLGHHLFHLLVFTGSEPLETTQREAAPRRQLLRRRLELQLGAEHLPDHIEFFPLHPRRREGRVDEDWCRAQYLTGMLHMKAREPMFQALSALRTWAGDETRRSVSTPPAGIA
jgi:hypothetical protein